MGIRLFKSTLEKACLAVEKILSWVLGSGFWVLGENAPYVIYGMLQNILHFLEHSPYCKAFFPKDCKVLLGFICQDA